MRNRWTIVAIGAALTLGACDKENGKGAPAANLPPVPSSTAPPAPIDRDNSGVNTRDRAPNAQTAGMAGQTKSDVQIAADIRKRLTDTKMSVNAQNAKIVVREGRVTLRGPVKNQSEKDSIGSIATDVVGADRVDNQLEVEASP